MRPLPLVLVLACAHHIPDPGAPPLAAEAAASIPSDLRVCWVEFQKGSLPHGLAVAHHALKADVVSTASGLLLQSPRGSWLIDGGEPAEVAAQFSEVHGVPHLLMVQSAKSFVQVATPAEGLRALGVDPASLSGLIPTHGHYDHLGGLLDLPDLPITLPQAEIDLAKRSLEGGPPAFLPAEARALAPRARPLDWTGGPFLYWEQSLDLYGDGSATLIPLPGHTPGSLGVYVRLPDGRAMFLVGDTVWAREGYEAREPKSWLAGRFDLESDVNDQQIARLWALHQARPDLLIVPAHDRRQWEAVFGAPGCLGMQGAPDPH